MPNSLTGLYLSSNQISEIKNLDALSSLTGLYLSSNQISEIKNLVALSSLTGLNLSRNQISSLSGLSIELLEKITRIDFSDNPIEGTTITDWKNPNAILGYLQSKQGLTI